MWQITKKDLLLLLRDRRALVVLVVLPLAIITTLGESFGRLLGWRDENQILKLAVVESDGQLAGELIDALKDIQGLRVDLVPDRKSASDRINNDESNATVEIGSDFKTRVEQLTLADIVRLNAGQLNARVQSFDVSVSGPSKNSATTAIAEQLVFIACLRVATARLVERSETARALLEKQEDQLEARSAFTDLAPTNRNMFANAESTPQQGSGVYQQIVPSYTVMFAFFLVNFMARSFISERELGTLRRLQMAPVSTSGLLLGKTLPFFFMSLIQCSILFLFGNLVYGMSWGQQPWWLVVVIVCTSMSATGLGLMVATLVRTDSQVSAYANFLVITLAGLSGCFMPRDWLPPMMQTASLSIPHSWALIAFDHVLNDASPDSGQILKCCSILVGFAVVFFGVGCWRFRRTW